MNDRDLLGDPIAPTPAMTDPLPMRVFAMNDWDWWMARTLDEAKTHFTRFTSVPIEDLADARELTDDELDRLRYVDESFEPGQRRSFRKELQRRVDAGVTEPQLFASTEY